MMKKNVFCVCFALLAMLLVGCDEKQSVFSLSNIKTFATVKGKMYYLEGIQYTSNGYKEIVSYPAGKKVWLDLDLSSIRQGATGIKTFEGTLSANGEYSFQVPTDASMGGATGKVRFEPFEGTFNVENDQTIGQVGSDKVIKQKTLYSATPIAFSGVMPSDIKIYSGVDRRYTGEDLDFYLEYNEVFSISGKIMQNAERLSTSPSALWYESIAYNGIVYIEVAYTNPTMTRVYYGTSTTNSASEGEYRILVPVKNKKSTLASIKAFAEDKKTDFIHYSNTVDPYTMMSGYMTMANTNPVAVGTYNVDLNIATGVVLSGVLKMEFTPYAGQPKEAEYNGMLAKWRPWYANATSTSYSVN